MSGWNQAKVMINQWFRLQLNFELRKENTIYFKVPDLIISFNQSSKLMIFSILILAICWITSIYLYLCHSAYWHWHTQERSTTSVALFNEQLNQNYARNCALCLQQKNRNHVMCCKLPTILGRVVQNIALHSKRSM